jgi:hypothetical protein
VSVRDLIKNRMRRSVERERALEPRFEAFSRLLWPWAESKLILFIISMAFLDSVSTYTALNLSINNQVSEVGLIASWALKTGGFPYLFLVEITIIAVLLLLAMVIRLFYIRMGFPGFGRAAFVFLLAPYTIVILAVVFNNILVTFLGHY